METIKELFGITRGGRQVFRFTLKNKQGIEVVVLNLGGIIQSIWVPDASGGKRDVCLGFDSVGLYEQEPGYLGAMIGRCANRIGGGMFELGGKTYELALNDGPNHLHGGNKGFDRHVYSYAAGGDKLSLTRRSPDMEEGYPGNLDVCFSYSLTDENELVLDYDAVSDADTIVNLTSHAYFNLAGEGKSGIHDHLLTIHGSYFSENDENCLPTGRLLSVENTPFDFRMPKAVGRDITAGDIQLLNGGGYDNNYILDSRDLMKPAAELVCPESGVTMTMSTTKPCIQFYSGNSLCGAMGKSGVYSKHGGLCLEAQYTPNALSAGEGVQPHFLKKGRRYNQKTIYRFGIT